MKNRRKMMKKVKRIKKKKKKRGRGVIVGLDQNGHHP